MLHPRKQVRDAVIDELSGIVSITNRVFASRVYPMQRQELPAALVYTSREEVQPLSEGPERTVRRDITVTVEAIARGGDDEIDELCLRIENVIASSAFLDDLVEDIYLSNTDVGQSGENEKPTIVARMDFIATLFHQDFDQPIAS
jgi:hypothetical protein